MCFRRIISCNFALFFVTSSDSSCTWRLLSKESSLSLLIPLNHTHKHKYSTKKTGVEIIFARCMLCYLGVVTNGFSLCEMDEGALTRRPKDVSLVFSLVICCNLVPMGSLPRPPRKLLSATYRRKAQPRKRTSEERNDVISNLFFFVMVNVLLNYNRFIYISFRYSYARHTRPIVPITHIKVCTSNKLHTLLSFCLSSDAFYHCAQA